MPTKTKPTPAPAVEGAKPTEKEKRQSRGQLLEGWLDRLRSTDIDILEGAVLISERHAGCTTPVEDFLVNVIRDYVWLDDDGRGLTPERIEHELEQLKENYESTVREAHFVASRHPLPEASDAQ
jgi:hypothetical protein